MILRRRSWLATMGAVMLAACGSSISTDVTSLRDPASVAGGAVLFEANCATCHGIDLAGGRAPGGTPAPALDSSTGPSDTSLIQTVNRGRGLAMPSFQNQLDDGEIASIIDFVRSVQAARLQE